MKRRDKNVDEFVLQHLGLHKTPPQDEMDLAEARIEHKLRTAPASIEDLHTLPRRRSILNRLAVGFATASAAVLVVFLLIPRGTDAEAAVLDGSFLRGFGTKTEIVHVGEPVKEGMIVRTNEGSAAIQLADSRVETKDQSEFLWERAQDGIRIRLNKGSVIVNGQSGKGKIYVQTANAMVFGTNSIFLVVAEENGSHIAVIRGEVRVQQGAAEKQLLPAEQLATNPSMEALQISEALAWSRSAAAHLAMFIQARGAVIEKPKEPTTFEVISIRQSAPLLVGSRGAPPAEGIKLSADLQARMARNQACGGPASPLELNPRRLSINGATVYRLLVLAYGLRDCSLALQTGLITNAPNWVPSERYDVEALIPEGAPAYTQQQLSRGEAPVLQLMMQNLLADRFKLVLHREPKNVVAFNLVVAKPGKIKLSEEQTPAEVFKGPFISSKLPRGVLLNCAGNAVAISQVANCLQRSVGGTIVDKTNLEGLYDIPQLFNWDFTVPASQGVYASQLLEQVGLKLEPLKTSGSVFVIDRVTKPSEN